MKNRLIPILAVIGVIVAGILFYAFFRAPEEASAPIESVPLVIETVEEVAAETADAEPTAAPEPEPTDEPEDEEMAEPTVEPTEEPAPEPTDEPAPDLPAAAIYEISQADSTATFTLGELLQGEPTEVVGITDQVAGQVFFDPADLSATQLGTILVNARTFVTDSEFRNRAIQNRILLTGDFEFVEFVPTDVTGLPEMAAPGEAVEFEIAGDLTIKGITQPAVFAAAVVFDSAESISGTATATVNRADYELNIPSVQGVADVDEEVALVITFVANAAE